MPCKTCGHRKACHDSVFGCDECCESGSESFLHEYAEERP